MRGLIGVFLSFLLVFFGPPILERYVKGVPDQYYRYGAVLAVFCGVVISLLTNPFSKWIRNPKAHPVSSTLTTATAISVISAAMWLFLVVRFLPLPSSVVTLQNVDEHVKGWARAFPENFEGGTMQEIPPNPQTYFGYGLIFADGIGIAVSRNKDKRYDHLIGLGANITLTDPVLAAYDSLSPDKKNQFARDIGTEVFRQRMNVDMVEPPQPIRINKMIPITDALTDEAFYSILSDMHSDIRLLMNAIGKLLTELNTPTTPAPAPIPEASPH